MPRQRSGGQRRAPDEWLPQAHGTSVSEASDKLRNRVVEVQLENRHSVTQIARRAWVFGQR